jgi:NTP pyrophosphatase (non-canonical NTP hydrolase)
MEKDLTIRKLQECIKNIDHKNNMNDKYMLKLMEEVGELAEAVRKNNRMQDDQNIKGTIEEELQDVLYYIVCLANVNDIDLQNCIYLKEKINCEKYNRKNMFAD